MVEKILADALGPDDTQLAAEEKQRLLSRLLARLAHEIRNPLSSLAIHVQLLEEDMAQAAPPLKAQAVGRFEIIRSELHRLENLVRQFLSLAAPSSVDLQTIEVAEIAGYVCELLRPEAAARGIEIVLAVPAVGVDVASGVEIHPVKASPSAASATARATAAMSVTLGESLTIRWRPVRARAAATRRPAAEASRPRSRPLAMLGQEMLSS